MKTMNLHKWAVAALLVWGALMMLPGHAHAHGQPVINVNPSVVSAGDTITITGSEMEQGEKFAITLEGVQGATALGTILVEGQNEEAGFTATFNVPQSLKPGSYNLRAATQAGESATVDLTVTAPSSKASAAPAQTRMASGELHEIARPRSALMFISVIAVALVSITLGLLLVLPRRKIVL